MMSFNRIVATAAPLMRPNIDTDQIIRIDRLIEHPRGELGPFCLESLRYLKDGSVNAEFAPNAARYRGAKILVAAENFGCGSSREHAVWALIDWGVRAVIAPNFGDIFYANSLQCGLLPVRLPAADVSAIAAELVRCEPPQITVDLEACTVTTPAGRILSFEIEPERREALLRGLDDISMTLRDRDSIERFRRKDEIERPWIYRQTEKLFVKKLLILAGDGIGPEIMAQTRRVVEWFDKVRGIRMALNEELFGISAWRKHGELMRDTTWDAVLDCDAILFGAIGSPEYETIPAKHRKADQLLRIRKELDLFINLRPVRAIKALADVSTIRPDVLEGTDMVMVRELTGGIYFGLPRGIETLPSGERRAVNTMTYTQSEIERIARAAFDLARVRNGRLCSVDKANVLENGVLWRETIVALHKAHYPDVDLSHLYVDNAAMQLVRNPRQFDVIVTENLFGDILSDCAAMIAGSIGMLPSASLSALSDNRSKALYEPIHGSAPDIAGKGVANPLGSILSFAMCLEHTFGKPQEARFLEAAVERVVISGTRTRDIAGHGASSSTTEQMGDAVLHELGLAHCRGPAGTSTR
jgi:3-isopropylmalate dehydrogenase